MGSASRTTDHQTIMDWVETRRGRPAHVKRAGDHNDSGILRIDFPGYSGEASLEPLDWDSWFDAFEANQLAFLYQEETASGELSRFSKLVRRAPEDEVSDAQPYQRGVLRQGRTRQLDLNTASEEEIDAVWGVGPATAHKIVQFRRRTRIESPDDLMRIEGLDGGTVDKLRRQMRVR